MSTPDLSARQLDQGPAAAAEALGRLRQILRPEFLAEAGWDPVGQVLAPAREHPLLGLPACAVTDCEAGIRTRGAVLCTLCGTRFRQAGVPLEVFVAIPSGKATRLGERLCRVTGCQRPTHSGGGLCSAHARQRWALGVGVEAFLARDDVTPRASFGDCQVPACIRRAVSRKLLCHPHARRWREARTDNPDLGLDEWARSQPPIGTDAIVILKGLPERVQLELLVALQQRTDRGAKTQMTVLRHVLKLLREHHMASVLELQQLDPAGLRHDVATTIRWISIAASRALSTVELECRKDVWDLWVFGLNGRLDFTPISQRWLREAAKGWAAEDLPQHRGPQASAAARLMLTCLAEFSQSLRLGRVDHGTDPTVLGRGDIVAFTNRLAHQQRTGKISAWKQVAVARDVRRFLGDIRPLGLTRPGQPAAGLPEDVALWRQDVPDEDEDDGPGRALPPGVLATIIEHLDLLEERSNREVRRITELLIDTGRRPDEICQLRWDCLDHTGGDKAVLRYRETKNQRRNRRLPIGQDTARLIRVQQQAVQARFPLTPVGELTLFPRWQANPRGTKPISEGTYTGAHRRFIDAIPVPLVDDQAPTGDQDGQGTEFDRAAVTPYAYRHSYAQRHADSGVAVDVLRELLGHRSLKPTQGYYRVTELRVRAAVDRVSRHQFDGQGRRVLRQVAHTLEAEHTRARVGQVAVPFGVCTEPSNVKAGGGACPYRYVCGGCGHFRSDPSYLPELKSYLQQLLADRERILAAADLEDWAREAAAPSEREIQRYRDLIRRVEADLEALDEDDRRQIADAVKVLRTTRQVVHLGMPGVRPPSPSTGPP
jgi:integrase